MSKIVVETITVEGTEYPIHRLADGTKVVITSKHGYRFSDGSSCQEEMDNAVKENSLSFAYLDKISVKREFTPAPAALPRKATESTSRLTPDSLHVLAELSKVADVILVSFMAVDALKQMGLRDQYPKVLAFNSTRETARVNAVSEKVVDLDNWAW